MPETQADTQLLATFVAVADEQSFTKAARRLGIGKGTVSRAIAQLEEQLGAELVHRTTRAVALSTAGVALYERVAPHVIALNQAVQKLPERAAVPSGELRMTAPQDIAIVVLPDDPDPVRAPLPRRPHRPARHQPPGRPRRRGLRPGDPRGDDDEGFDADRAPPRHRRPRASTPRPATSPAAAGPKRIGDARPRLAAASVRARRALKLPSDTPARIVCDDFMVIRALARAGAGIGMMPPFVGAPYVSQGLLEDLELDEPASLRAGLYIALPVERPGPAQGHRLPGLLRGIDDEVALRLSGVRSQPEVSCHPMRRRRRRHATTATRARCWRSPSTPLAFRWRARWPTPRPARSWSSTVAGSR